MEEQERPRKLAKLDHEDITNEVTAPAMTGAVNVAGNEPEPANAQIGNEPLDLSEFTVHKDTKTANEPTTQDGAEGAAPVMSKNQMKKLRRAEAHQQKRALQKAQKKDKIIQKRERRHAMILEAREKGGEEAVNELRVLWRGNKAKHTRSTLLPLTFVMDCGYDELMSDRERISLAGQLTRSYSDNSRAPYNAHMMFSSFDKLLKERFDTVLACHKNWKRVRFLQEDFVRAGELAKEQMTSPRGGQLAGPFAEQTDAKPEDGEIIYLSSDSENTLTELKPYCTYIVGALVDKNRHKAVCYKQAVAKGIKTAKLPIGQYIQMAHRPVLATNHVIEIMLQWLELRDWGKAFMKVIPTRKGGALKGEQNGGEAEALNDEEDGNQEEIEADQMKQLEEIAAFEEGSEDDNEGKE
ncbi:tRNA (guanine(9)-N(1))-methyltransferase TRM10 [Penicillium cf. griseofulvum]|uniref:tRNA (guanine(9)-N1)-methyltransferase n=1 Tax=Penicillium cf. griseofulvum TaxID=2972120 RepID=A0A9W9MZZ8_9EURO|nr:tRNA (guanine(9)-N(1))-methyltransferase TRM10 [Penicillium cf. griseofulvum]KAJ5422067.1 tRNA (guanine(9)-N(1))-methyltransferase TRM10 [Penicillium cf. griseofulvum]KAJ5428257.1 tRNA (guanine(9)-N(1))-methyltransferase TRM10 [Penicillium cf. griseofulvum]